MSKQEASPAGCVFVLVATIGFEEAWRTAGVLIGIGRFGPTTPTNRQA